MAATLVQTLPDQTHSLQPQDSAQTDTLGSVSDVHSEARPLPPTDSKYTCHNKSTNSNTPVITKPPTQNTPVITTKPPTQNTPVITKPPTQNTPVTMKLQTENTPVIIKSGRSIFAKDSKDTCHTTPKLKLTCHNTSYTTVIILKTESITSNIFKTNLSTKPVTLPNKINDSQNVKPQIIHLPQKYIHLQKVLQKLILIL